MPDPYNMSCYPSTLLSEFGVLNQPEDSLHRTIRTVVASYNSPWDPLTELIQNAVDAINQRAATNAGGAYSGVLKITIDSTKSTIVIEDNGIGIPPKKTSTLLLPGGSLKTQGNTYGHKGLGFCYAAHVSDEISVETVDHLSNQADSWTFSHAFDWLTNPQTATATLSPLSASFRSLSGAGTSVCLKLATGRYEHSFANTAILDRFFRWAADESLLSFVLRTRTAIGHVGPLFGTSPTPHIDVHVELVAENRRFSVPYSYFDFGSQPPLSQQPYKDATAYHANVWNNPARANRIHYGVWHVFKNGVAQPPQPAPPLKVGRTRGGVKFEVFLYACGRDNLAAALRAYDPRLDDEFSDLAIKTDVHLAIDGMPSGVPIDTWSKHGSFEQRYFAMVNAELSFGSVLDAGRKTITRYYVDLLINKTLELTKDTGLFGNMSFRDCASQLHTRSTGVTRPPIDYINAWKTLPKLPTSQLLIHEVPNDELAAYVLFGELVGRRFIPGYRLLYVSGGAIYDAAFECKLNLKDRAHLNSSASGTCLFGVGSSLVQRHAGTSQFQWTNTNTGQQHLVVEFKVAAEELLDELTRRGSGKQIQDLNLLVCITADPNQIQQRQAALSPVSESARLLPGVTHELHYNHHVVQVICLRTVIESLAASGLL